MEFMKALQIREEDIEKAEKVLKKNGIQVHVKEDDSQKDTSAKQPSVRRGKRKMGDLPSSFGGVWAKDERTLETIRQKAWPKRT